MAPCWRAFPPNDGPLVAGISPELVPCWRAFPRMGGSLAGGRSPSLGDDWPCVPKLAPRMLPAWPPNASISYSRGLPEFPRILPEITRVLPEITRILPEITRILPKFARILPEFARILPEFPRIARVRPNCPGSPELPEFARFSRLFCSKGVSRNRQAETNAPPLEGGLRSCETAPSNRAEDKNPVASSSKG